MFCRLRATTLSWRVYPVRFPPVFESYRQHHAWCRKEYHSQCLLFRHPRCLTVQSSHRSDEWPFLNCCHKASRIYWLRLYRSVYFLWHWMDQTFSAHQTTRSKRVSAYLPIKMHARDGCQRRLFLQNRKMIERNRGTGCPMGTRCTEYSRFAPKPTYWWDGSKTS